MNINSFHTENKPLQTKKIFSPNEAVISIQLEQKAELKEHITKTPALLIVISGEVIYEDELGSKEVISNGDFYNIKPNVKHWLIAMSTCNLILIK